MSWASECENMMYPSEHNVYLSEVDVPGTLTIFPDTDGEGEPQVMATAEMWPKRGTRKRVSRRARQGVPAGSGVARTTQQSAPAVTQAQASGHQWYPSSLEGGRIAEEQDRMSSGGSEDAVAEVTTLVIRNLPEQTTQQRFLDEVNQSGFAGTYNFAYLPRGLHGSRSGGHAFVNFVNADFAACFRAAWHGSTHVGVAPGATSLNVVPASLQGFDKNTRKWSPNRLARVKNPNFLPLILKDSSPAASLQGLASASVPAEVDHQLWEHEAWAEHGDFATAPEARLTPEADSRDGKKVTTLVVRNLPSQTTQQEFLEEINRSGFARTYDFAYLPRRFDSGQGSGHAFVNFKSPELAAAFKAAWHRSAHLCGSQQSQLLNVVPSSIQGFYANTSKWTPARVAQVKNVGFLPFVCGPHPAACQADELWVNDKNARAWNGNH